MQDARITKKALAASLKCLMEVAPLSRISVRDIVDDCGVNRQTFYYHFRDKYEPVNRIYKTEAVESIADARDYAHWTERIGDTVEGSMRRALEKRSRGSRPLLDRAESR